MCTCSLSSFCFPVLGPAFYSLLQCQKNIQIKPGQLTDIYGGQLYQALASDGGCLADDRNISMVLNTDGVVVFHSTNLSIWPVLLMINELPFSQRYMHPVLHKRSNVPATVLFYSQETTQEHDFGWFVVLK